MRTSRVFLKANAEAADEIGGATRRPYAFPEWTLLAMSYLMSGAVVWVVRAFFVEAG